MQRLLAAIAAALFIGSFCAASACAAGLVTPTTREGQKDFDFLLGSWHTYYRLLRKRLSNDHEWYSCEGTSLVHPFWGGSEISKTATFAARGVTSLG